MAVFGLILLFSKRIIRPILESYEKQKRFITDAGHEIRTPITIIDADAEILEMEEGENEWLKDIKAQTKRLTALTNDLVFLSRMEEEKPRLAEIELPFSDLVSETAQSFQAPAKTQGKHLSLQIQPMLTVKGDEKALRQLGFHPAGKRPEILRRRERHPPILGGTKAKHLPGPWKIPRRPHFRNS